ncbi:hypothetical protein MRX96_014926 [Rhipicephalus microplus]
MHTETSPRAAAVFHLSDDWLDSTWIGSHRLRFPDWLQAAWHLVAAESGDAGDVAREGEGQQEQTRYLDASLIVRQALRGVEHLGDKSRAVALSAARC